MSMTSEMASKVTRALSSVIELVSLTQDIMFNNAYSNAFDTEKGVIVAMASFRELDLEVGKGNPAVPWSDLIYWRYAKLARDHGHRPSALRYIVQWNVSNAQSLAVIFEAYRKAGKGETDYGTRWEVWTFSKHGETFLALLGTPNALGTAHMVIGFPQGLKRKTVKSIHTRRDSISIMDTKWIMIIELE